jgi:hypothetical protein
MAKLSSLSRENRGRGWGWPAGWRRLPPATPGTSAAGERVKANRTTSAVDSSPHTGLWWRTERDRRRQADGSVVPA